MINHSLSDIYHIDLNKYQERMMLSDELNECQKSFTAKKGDFDIKMYLQVVRHQSVLVIQLKNQVKMQFFNLTVDKNYLSQYSDMSFCFQTPEDLFYTLLQLFKDIHISEDGLLTFEMKLNATKLKKKVFKLEIVKQNIDKTQMMRLKLQSMKKQFKIQTAAKNQKIQQLSKETKQLRQTIETLRQQVSEIKRESEELSLQYKKKDFKMNSIIKQSDLQRQEISILRKSLEEFHKKFSLLQFYNFFDNPHWHYFSVYRGQQSVIIIKKDNDNLWHNFIRNVPLAAGKTYQFKIRQLKTNYKNIMIGIITRQSFGVTNAYKEKSCIAYNSYNGNVWEKGTSRKGGTAVRDGQIVAVQVNLIDFKIFWFIEGKKIAQALISEPFRNKEIYLCLQLYNIEDQLQLMLY